MNKSTRTIRTGMMAYMGIAASVRAEQEGKDNLSLLMDEVDVLINETFPKMAAIPKRNGTYKFMYYNTDIKVTYRTRRALMITATYEV